MRLRDALRKARIEAADRTGVVVDLRDAEVARLEILNEALDPLFAQMPDKIDLFERGISQGETPRLWIDVVAHVVMGRDKRIYRFVQDTRYRPHRARESHEVTCDRRGGDRLCRPPHDRTRARDGRRRQRRSQWQTRNRAAAASGSLRWASSLGAMALFALALFASLKNL